MAWCASAQPAPFTLDQVLGSAFPTELTAAPAGSQFAWISETRGVRNIMVAQAPQYQARKITNYTDDDGQDLSNPTWTPDGHAVVYVRGQGRNRAGQYPDPSLDPNGAEQDIWIAPLNGEAPKKIGEGSSPDVSPNGGRVVFVRRGQLWWAPLTGDGSASQLATTRGACERPKWSPDGTRISFTSNRGDHSFIGVYNVSDKTLLYLDPGTDFDSDAAWSPDSRRVAFLRQPSTGNRRIYGPQRTGAPWSIRSAEAATGEGREVWRARDGAGSVFREVKAENQILWGADGRLVFPWEGDGWTHLYSLPEKGGSALLLTPGDFEVEHVSISRDGREVVYSSNQDDIDRRHIWKVAVAGGAPVAVTSGNGIEVWPVFAGDGTTIAFLRSDAQHPLRPAVKTGGTIRDLDPNAIPADFPLSHMVTPEQVVFASSDGLRIHGQLFLPPKRSAARAPAIVFFHGGSRRQMLLGWHYMHYYSNAYALNQYLANQGFVVLSVNFRSGIGYGLDFREAPGFGAAGASDYNDVQGAGLYLSSRPEVDPTRIGVWGGSYGGFLTAMALARSSDLFKAGVDFAGVHNWALELEIPPEDPAAKIAYESSPMAFVSKWRSPVLLIQGDDDRNVQFRETVNLADALRRNHVDFQELIFPDEVHEFLLYRHWLQSYEAAARFLEQHLLPSHAPKSK